MRTTTLARSTGVLVAITIAIKALGFVEKQVIAYYFEADARVDAFFVAVSVPFALFLFVREIVEPAFLPVFVRHLDAGRRRRVWQLFATVAAGIVVVTTPVVAVAWSDKT